MTKKKYSPRYVFVSMFSSSLKGKFSNLTYLDEWTHMKEVGFCDVCCSSFEVKTAVFHCKNFWTLEFKTCWVSLLNILIVFCSSSRVISPWRINGGDASFGWSDTTLSLPSILGTLHRIFCKDNLLPCLSVLHWLPSATLNVGYSYPLWISWNG